MPGGGSPVARALYHEPMHDDKQLSRLEAETRRLEQITRGSQRPLDIISAYDGLSISL